jgi:hypothetical protein
MNVLIIVGFALLLASLLVLCFCRQRNRFSQEFVNWPKDQRSRRNRNRIKRRNRRRRRRRNRRTLRPWFFSAPWKWKINREATVFCLQCMQENKCTDPSFSRCPACWLDGQWACPMSVGRVSRRWFW